jgi:hypothetical protein
MRYAPTFVSVIALVWAAAMALRAERLPWIVPAYVIAQCLFALIAFLGLQRRAIETRGYMLFFGVTFGTVLLFAVGFAVWIAWRHPQILGGWLIVGTLFQSSAAAAIVYFELLKAYPRPGTVPAQLQMAVFQGGVLTFCGAVALISLALRLPPELAVSTAALGGFWTALGILAFCWALGVTRNQAVWLTLNNFLPAMLAVIAFGWMAFELGKLQAEGSRQAVPHYTVETTTEAP